MPETKEHNHKHGNSNKSVIATAVISAILGGTGINFVVGGTSLGQNIFRPDPATGTDIRRLEKDIEQHTRNHPDVINKFDRRIAVLETQYAVILANQQRILAKLDER